MRGSSHRQRLDERDPKHEARLGIVGEPLAGGSVDEGVEIRQAAKRFGGDGVGEAAIVAPLEFTRSGVERRFQRKAFAQDRIEQAKRRPPGAGARRVGAAQRRRPSGSSAEERTDSPSGSSGGGEWRPSSPAIASSAAILFSVAGWVEKRLSPPRASPGTM